jgi:hypothetical protein
MRKSQIRSDRLFSKSEWVGEFYPPNQFEKRFAGKVTYSPTDGAVLAFTVVLPIDPPDGVLVHGMIDHGIPCTAFGRFNPDHMGYSNRAMLGKVGLEFFVIGEHLSADDRYKTVSFALTGLQDFFFPSGFPQGVKYEGKPIHTIKVDFGEVEIFQVVTFEFLDLSNIDGWIWSPDSDAMEAMRASLRAIKQEHPQAGFMLRNDLAYKFTLKSQAGFSLHEADKYIRSISELFALFRLNPTFPEEIMAFKDVDARRLPLDIYPWLSLNQSIIDRAKKERSHHLLPLTIKDINLPAAVERWLAMRPRFDTIISSIQYEVGFRTPHSAHGDLVLFATQLETISQEAGEPEKRKYAYPLEKFCHWQLKEKFEALFKKANVTDIPVGISDLRNEITHINRPKRLLSKLSVGDLMDIARCMQLLVLSYVLDKLGVAEQVRGDYQTHLLPWSQLSS